LQTEPPKLRLPAVSRPPNPTPQKYRGIIQSMRLIVKEEGLRGLWKGNISAAYLYLTYGAVQFFTYHELTGFLKTSKYAKDVPDTLKSFAGGALAGFLATLTTYPFDLLRTRFAIQGEGPNTKPYTSLLNAIQQIQAKEGLRGFYRGVWPSAVQIMPYMGIMFQSQSLFSNFFKAVEDRWLKQEHEWVNGSLEFLSGGLAGIISKTAVMPFDVVRKRMQVQGPDRNHYIFDSIPRYSEKGMMACARQIVRHEGVLGLYKGLWPSLLKAGPSSAVTFLVVGECRKAFR
ncbi:mitochondrial thiamine pyrophosphate transporter, partial [Chytridiales sp. JEL 0842]